MDNALKVSNLLLLRKLNNKRANDSTESSSESSDEEIFVKMAKYEPQKHEKVKNFVKEIALNYSPSDFQKHFRLNRIKFEELLTVLKPDDINCGGRTPYPLLDGLLLTIWTLATQESYRQIGSRFNVSEGHAYRIVIKLCIQICNLKDRYIIWPSGEQTNGHIKEFNRLRGEQSFPNVFGCLDGTQIPIPGPTRENSYYNRKGFHSMQLQGICDARAKFIYVFCGWPGSVHDARVWQSCELHKKLEENPLDLLPLGTYLLGDSAYPLAKYLITPFKDTGHLTKKQKKFNYKLSSTRVIIEQAFGRLKGMFRRLKYLHVFKFSNCKYMLIAACILHNLCIDDSNVKYECCESDECFSEELDTELHQLENREAVELRNQIMNKIIP